MGIGDILPHFYRTTEHEEFSSKLSFNLIFFSASHQTIAVKKPQPLLSLNKGHNTFHRRGRRPRYSQPACTMTSRSINDALFTSSL